MLYPTFFLHHLVFIGLMFREVFSSYRVNANNLGISGRICVREAIPSPPLEHTF